MKVTFDPYDPNDFQRVHSFLTRMAGDADVGKRETKPAATVAAAPVPAAAPAPVGGTVAAAPVATAAPVSAAPAPAPVPAVPASAPVPAAAPAAAAPAGGDDQATLVDLIQRHSKAFGPKATVDFFAGKQIKGLAEVTAEARPGIIAELEQLLAFAS